MRVDRVVNLNHDSCRNLAIPIYGNVFPITSNGVVVSRISFTNFPHITEIVATGPTDLGSTHSDIWSGEEPWNSGRFDLRDILQHQSNNRYFWFNFSDLDFPDLLNPCEGN